MKLVYFGSDVFLSCFEYFLQAHEILALYTYHNDEDYFSEYAIVEKAKRNGIPVHYEDITQERICRYFEDEGCELLFVAEYDRVLPVPPALARFRGINTHSSLLPQGRSYYPIESAMARGLTCTGVTMHKVASELDRGDILAQCTIPIAPDTDSIDLYLLCAARAREMLEPLIANLDTIWDTTQPQSTREPYWYRPAHTARTLLHEMTRQEAHAIFRRYNAMTCLQSGGRWYYVTALDSGRAPFAEDARFLGPSLLLYRVKDGHLRLHVRPVKGDRI